MAKSTKKVKKAQVVNPVAPQPITELELILIETNRLMLAKLRKQVRETEAKLEQSEEDVLKRLSAGAIVEGRKTAIAMPVKGPSRPKWKEEYVAHFEAEHGQTLKFIEERMEAKYPGKPGVALVIGEKPSVH